VREIGKVPMMGTRGEKLCEGSRETGGSHDDVMERLNYPVRSNRKSDVIHDNVMEKGILTGILFENFGVFFGKIPLKICYSHIFLVYYLYMN
jgi:hypothetical protein